LSFHFGGVCKAAAIAICLTLSVRPSAGRERNNSHRTDIWKIPNLVYVPKFVDTNPFGFKSDKNYILHEDVPTFMWSF